MVSTNVDVTAARKASEFFLLLPLLNSSGSLAKETGGEGTSFYLITSEWNELSRASEDSDSYKLGMPKIPCAKYGR